MEDTEGHGKRMHNFRSRKGYDFGTVTERIIKCAIAVHKELGRFFMETTY